MIGEQFTTVAPVVLHRRSEVLAAPPSPAVQFLQAASAAGDARFAGIPSLIGVPLSGMLFGLPDFRNMSALPVRRYFDYMQAMDPESGSFTIQSVPTARSPLLDLAAVRYFVLPAPDTTAGADPADSNLRRRYADDRVVVYENLAALPRARVVHRAVHVADAATPARWLQAFGRLRRTAREAGLAELALIEPDENGTRAPDVSGGASERERVQLAEHEDPDRLVITARLETPGFVVIADTYYPGWKAWLDGRRTPLFPANLLFRAVHVPAGSHTIELRYQPAAVFYGILLSTLAALASLLVILASLRRARRRSIMHR